VKKRYFVGVILVLVLLVSLGASYGLSAQTAALSRTDLAWIQPEDADLSDLSAPVESGSPALGATAQAAVGATVDSLLIQPESDLEYLGAFRLPDEESNGTSWSYGGRGMGYYPGGDPSGAADGYPGSLFSISHPYQNYVSEFTIPPPVISPGKEIGDLPVAETLQPFTDVTGGRQTGGLTGTTLGDIQYYPRQGAQASDKLYWVMFNFYMPPEDGLGHGWCELDFSDIQSQGVWRFDGFPFAATSRYLFDIPQSWADAYTPGRRLAAGRYRLVNGGSAGPALYAFGPWNDGNPPPDGSSLGATELLWYASDLALRDFGHRDQFNDGAWLTVGDKSAVIFAGLKATRSEASGLEYYGVPGVDGCGGKGYHGDPYYGAILFYDPELLAQVVQGEIEPYEVQPYAVFNVDDYMFVRGCREYILGGTAYDREHGLLYVIEQRVEGIYALKPIVHVFGVTDQAQPADRSAPTAPANLSADSVTFEQIDFSWDGSSDNVHVASYVVYRDGEPMATTPGTSYIDAKVNPSATYSYTVAARDWRDNASAPSDALVVTTPTGSDSRAPIISNFRVTDITATSVVVSWKTDELATTRIRYEVLYSGDETVIQDGALTTTHRVALSGLTPNTVYRCHVASVDAANNENEYARKDFRTSTLGGSENFAPVLNGVGSRRIYEGESLQFVVGAHDLDGEALTYSATGLPQGASFDTAAGQFSWTPDFDDAGTHRVTFTVSDGDQSDSERVTIFVLDNPALVLRARPADKTVYLTWAVSATLPTSSTWHIDYYTQTLTAPFTATDSLSATRSYTLTDLTNGDWYTVTLHAMAGQTSWLSDTVRVMPTDKFVYLPLVLREN